MAYKGYLLKIGDYEFPMSKIKAETYQAYVNMQAVEPWTDANGYLHYDAVDLKALKVEFETVPMLTNTEFEKIMSSIRSNYEDSSSRKCFVEAYIPEYDSYITQLAYMADFTPQIYGTYQDKIHYNSIRMAFIGGVYSDS